MNGNVWEERVVLCVLGMWWEVRQGRWVGLGEHSMLVPRWTQSTCSTCKCDTAGR